MLFHQVFFIMSSLYIKLYLNPLEHYPIRASVMYKRNSLYIQNTFNTAFTIKMTYFVIFAICYVWCINILCVFSICNIYLCALHALCVRRSTCLCEPNCIITTHQPLISFCNPIYSQRSLSLYTLSTCPPFNLLSSLHPPTIYVCMHPYYVYMARPFYIC